MVKRFVHAYLLPIHTVTCQRLFEVGDVLGHVIKEKKLFCKRMSVDIYV